MANKRIVDFNAKTTPVDADSFVLWSAAESATRKVTGANLKAYVGAGATSAAGTDGSIQINSGGSFSHVTGLRWNSLDDRLEAPTGNSDEWNEAHTERITAVAGSTAASLTLTRPNAANLSLNHTHATLSPGDGLTGTTYNGSVNRIFDVDTTWDADFATLSIQGTMAINDNRDYSGRDATLAREVKSSPYAAGPLGNGWRLQREDANGNSFLEVDNLRVRKEFRTHIFRKEEIRAVNGRIYVTDASEAIETKTFGPGTSGTLNIRKGAGYATFNIGDSILIRNLAPDLTTINDVSADISGITDEGDYIELGLENITPGTVYTGDTIVRTSGGTIMLDANTEGSPYMDVLDDGSVKVRVGSLESISNATGFGFYGENAYLTGTTVLGDLTKTNNYIEYSDGNLTINVNNFDLTSLFTTGSLTYELSIRNSADFENIFHITEEDAGEPDAVDKFIITRTGDMFLGGNIDLDGNMTVDGSIITEFDDGSFIRGVRIEDGQLITSLNGNDLGHIRTSGAKFRSGTGATSAQAEITTTHMQVNSNPTTDTLLTGFSTATGIDIRQFAGTLRPAHRDGRIVYNSTTNKFQGSVDGAWVDLH